MQQKQKYHHEKHIPVLLDEILELLSPQAGESYLDLTAGYGGHAGAILERTNAPQNATLVDRDASAIESLRGFERAGAQLIRSDFASFVSDLPAGVRYDVILMDIGVSSMHLNTSERGFSFARSGPLDMRMDQRQELDASQIVNEWSKDQLITILREYGEERRAAAVANAIVTARPMQTTNQLADIVARALGGRRGKTHPATKTFQAIRIAVNDELRQLHRALGALLPHVAPGGRLAVISFHSLEDRIVKRFFADIANPHDLESAFRLLTKKPVTASLHHTVHNPRARSAKLRAVVKINNKRKGQTHAN